MKGYWHVQRHEDKLTLGIPDVSFGIGGGGGWIELKYLHEWPKMVNTVVSIDHYTSEQRRWLRNRGRYNQNCWLFLRVGKDEFMLFDWQQAQMVGQLTKRELIVQCDHIWSGKIDFQALVKILSS